MYEERFKKWGLREYSKKTKKHKMGGGVVLDFQTQSNPDLEINKDHRQKDLRYLQEMHRTKAMDLPALCSRAAGK